MVRVPSAARFASTESSSTGCMNPLKPVCGKLARSTVSVRIEAAASEPCSPTLGTPIRSTAPPNDRSSAGKGASEKSIPPNCAPKRNCNCLPTDARACPCDSSAATKASLPSLIDLAFLKRHPQPGQQLRWRWQRRDGPPDDRRPGRRARREARWPAPQNADWRNHPA